MIKKKSNVRKYSRKVKNKKVKYSKKLMSGGARLSPSQTPKSLQPPHSLKKPLMFKFNTPFEKKIMELYEFSKLKEVKDYISKHFRKFEYSYAQTNPAYKETDSILYLKKDEVDNEINPTEVFKVYAPTNQSISIEYNDDKKFKDIGKFYEITPLELSVDTMQLAVNTGKLEVSTDKDGNSYLGFVDFPSLVITEKPSGTGFSYSSRKNATWISVYEQEFEEKDKLFDLIETTDGRHIEQSTFDSEIETIDVKISKLDKIKNNDEITNLENSKPTKKGDVKMTNEALFIKKQDEMRILLSDIEISSDEKAKLKQKIEEQVKYRAYVNIEEDGDGSNKNVITEDISWAMKNSLWLEKYLKIKTEDNSLTAQELKTKIEEDYDCDLSGLDEKYVIVDEFENKVENGGDGETYVICGYPEEKMKEIILNFWQDENMKKEFDKVYKDQRDNNCKLFMELFNFFKKDNKLNTNDTTNLFELYLKPREKVIQYLEQTYKSIYTTPNEFETKIAIFKNNFKIYYNKLAKQYMSKIIKQIKYVFLVLKKNMDKNKKEILTPFIFNIKELLPEYKPILEQIEILIKHNLSYIFDILSHDEYIKKNSYENQYKLYYSRYIFGKIFYIETQFTNTMSNLSNKAHTYKNSITLEELIYNCGILSKKLKPYWKILKLIYDIREYKLSLKIDISNTNNLKNNIFIERQDCLSLFNKSRSDYVFCLYEQIKNKKIQSKTNKRLTQQHKNYYKIVNTSNTISNNLVLITLQIKLTNKIILGMIIILMFKSSIQEYTIIYKYNNEFYKLVITSTMSSNIDLIIKNLHYLLNNDLFSNTISFNKNDELKLFKVIKNQKLNDKDIKLCFSYNPIIMKRLYNNMKYNTNIGDIDTSYYYDTDLIDKTLLEGYVGLVMKNIYNLYNTTNQKPILVQSFLDSNTYNEGLKLYLDNKLQKNCKELSYEEDASNFWNCITQKCPDIKINCIFYDLEGCGYDFIESLDDSANKITVYIVPNKYSKNKNNKYIGNFMDLDGSSLDMLNAFKKKYDSYNCICFLHATITTIFYCLHFHIVKKQDINHNVNYNRIYNDNEFGSFIIKDIFIDEILNNLSININYYNETNFCLIKGY